MQTAMSTDFQKCGETELLELYASGRSEDAFAELVRRQVDLVYSAALRQVGGDAAAAGDVTQAVFVELARKARSLMRHPALNGWLYTTARRIALRHVRTEFRRRNREQEAQEMEFREAETGNEVEWVRILPVLDEAMHELSETDRHAVLLRHFERRPLAEVGARLGLGENAARMRVERSLNKLRRHLARRGVTSTRSALASVLAGEAVGSAPPALAAAVTGAALGGAATVATGFHFLTLMAANSYKIAVAGVLLTVAGTLLVSQHRESARLRADNQDLRDQLARSESAATAAAETAARDAEELTRLRAHQDELLRLRGELAGLRNRRGVSPAPDAPERASVPPPPPAYSANVRTTVQPGQMVVTGGWSWTEGRRGVLLVTPSYHTGDDGQPVIEITHNVVLVPEETMSGLGWDSLGSDSREPSEHRVLSVRDAKVLMEQLKSRRDVEVMSSPTITARDSERAGIGLTSDDRPDAVSFDVVSHVQPDGRIDLNLVGSVEKAPAPRSPESGGSTGPGKAL
ncbi:MAG: sigma-70 family RNA polymerase sigma factor [Verrucomicrobiales bacterium]|nr:sigma-70 family RNA polymerase sigma factor [Verrucomicrobiales bacterium]